MLLSMTEFIEYVNEKHSEVLEKPLTARMVRYLISQGIMSKPDGATSASRYSEKHIRQVYDYFRMKKGGLTVQQISNISRYSDGNMSSFELTEGMTLLVANSLYPERIDEERAVKTLREVINHIKGER